MEKEEDRRTDHAIVVKTPPNVYCE